MSLAKTIDALLPQTQCGECGYPGCMPYAQALAAGLAPIDRCSPGGVKTLKELAHVLNVDESPYVQEMAKKTRPAAVAVIKEAECIGCTKCIQACPVDAIVGSAKHMHSILSHECTGCGLCIDPCPVDCIELSSLSEPAFDPNLARVRFNQRKIRLLREEQAKEASYRNKRLLAKEKNTQDVHAKQHYIQDALARVRARKNNE